MYACVYLCVCTCVHVCACVPAQVESLYSPGTSGSRVRVGGSVRGRQDVAHRSRSLSLPPAGPGVPGGGACAIFLLVPLARSQSVVLTQWHGQINGDLLCLLCLRDGRLLLSVAVRTQPVCAAAGGAARPGEGCPTLPPLSHLGRLPSGNRRCPALPALSARPLAAGPGCWAKAPGVR